MVVDLTAHWVETLAAFVDSCSSSVVEASEIALAAFAEVRESVGHYFAFPSVALARCNSPDGAHSSLVQEEESDHLAPKYVVAKNIFKEEENENAFKIWKSKSNKMFNLQAAAETYFA